MLIPVDTLLALTELVRLEFPARLVFCVLIVNILELDRTALAGFVTRFNELLLIMIFLEAGDEDTKLFGLVGCVLMVSDVFNAALSKVTVPGELFVLDPDGTR